MKRVVALILALITIFSFFSINVSAASTKTERVYGSADKSTIRITGDNRYKTSINTANKLKKALNVSKFNAIIVAYGRNYADALAGSYLASLVKAPILLVNTDPNNTNDKESMSLVKEYINKNLKKKGTVYVLGGEAVISEKYVKSLKASGRTVKRLAGENRYATNIKILNECLKYQAKPKTVLVCDAYNYADSLSVSSLGKPILLIDKQGKKLTSEQKSYLSKLSLNKAYIIGGTAAVPSAIEKSMKSYCTVTRISGANRYETSTKIAQTFYKSPKGAVVAYGHDFPDGLCGGPLAYTMKYPLVLVYNDSGAKNTNLYYAKNYFNKNSISRHITLGGVNAISKDTEKVLNKAFAGEAKVSDIKNIQKILDVYCGYCFDFVGIEPYDENRQYTEDQQYVLIRNYSSYAELKKYVSKFIDDNLLEEYYPDIDKQDTFKEMNGKLYARADFDAVAPGLYYSAKGARLYKVVDGDTYVVICRDLFPYIEDEYSEIACYFKKHGNSFKLTEVKYTTIDDISNYKKLVDIMDCSVLRIVDYDIDKPIYFSDKGDESYQVTNFKSVKEVKEYLLKNFVTKNYLDNHMDLSNYALGWCGELFERNGKLYISYPGFSPSSYIDADTAYVSKTVTYNKEINMCIRYKDIYEKTDLGAITVRVVVEDGKTKLDEIVEVVNY